MQVIKDLAAKGNGEAFISLAQTIKGKMKKGVLYKIKVGHKGQVSSTNLLLRMGEIDIAVTC